MVVALPLPRALVAYIGHVADTVSNETAKSHSKTVANVDNTETTSLLAPTVHCTDENDAAWVDTGLKETEQESQRSQLREVFGFGGDGENHTPQHDEECNVLCKRDTLDKHSVRALR